MTLISALLWRLARPPALFWLLFSLLFLLLGCVGRGADGQAGRGGASEPSVSMYLRISLRRKMLVMSRRVLTSVDESCCSVYFASTGSTYLGW